MTKPDPNALSPMSQCHNVIRPGGKVEFIGSELRKLPKPDKADNRSFYLNCAMNGLTKEGFEFAGISNDDIIMKRANAR